MNTQQLRLIKSFNIIRNDLNDINYKLPLINRNKIRIQKSFEKKVQKFDKSKGKRTDLNLRIYNSNNEISNLKKRGYTTKALLTNSISSQTNIEQGTSMDTINSHSRKENSNSKLLYITSCSEKNIMNSDNNYSNLCSKKNDNNMNLLNNRKNESYKYNIRKNNIDLSNKSFEEKINIQRERLREQMIHRNRNYFMKRYTKDYLNNYFFNSKHRIFIKQLYNDKDIMKFAKKMEKTEKFKDEHENQEKSELNVVPFSAKEIVNNKIKSMKLPGYLKMKMNMVVNETEKEIDDIM